MRVIVFLICLLLTVNAYAENVNSVKIASHGISADTVLIPKSYIQQLPSLAIFSVYLTPNLVNSGKVWVGGEGITKASPGYELTITGGSVKLNVENLNQIYVTGNSTGDRVHYIAEKQ